MMRNVTRRTAIGASAAFLLGGRARAATPAAVTAATEGQERKLGGRIGIAAWDLETKMRFGYKADERFPMTSTFKVLAAGLVLARVDRGDEDLERRVLFAPADVVGGSPVTRDRVHGEGMPIWELCEAAVTRSDNTAGNLLLASFGGPPALTAWLRGLGDEVTRLDRLEPEVNEAKADDPRDTTSPNAMVDSLRRLLFDQTLTQGSRDRLSGWLRANKTGDRRLRAGFPKGWTVGDRTGTGLNGAVGDVAVAWPSAGRAPVLVAVYLQGSKAGPAQLDDAIAEIGRRLVTLG